MNPFRIASHPPPPFFKSVAWMKLTIPIGWSVWNLRVPVAGLIVRPGQAKKG